MQNKNRKQNRLKNYDYSQQGMYFVTICTKNREYLFGEIENGKMILNGVGEIANKCWLEIPNHFPHVFLDEFVVMPNHIHGVIEIKNVGNNIKNVGNNIKNVGNNNYCSLHPWQTVWSKSISSAVRGFKIGVTKWCRRNDWKKFAWQKSFHDRIIRNEKELNKIREYIFKNPQNWETDRNNNENLWM
jgi:putative transposase